MNGRDKHQTVAEQAVHWLLRNQQTLTRAEQAAFAEWLAQPANQAEYHEMRTLWQESSTLPAAALAHLRPSPVARQRRRLIPAVICTLLLLVIGFWPLRDYFATPTYSASWQTARGEMRQVALPDGTQISLDAGTRLQVRYFGHRREVVMEQGQAFFQVAHLPQQPFTVSSGPARVTVIGTEFRLRYLPHSMSGDGVDVAVSSGAVRVGPRSRWRYDGWRLLQHLHFSEAAQHLTVLHALQRATSDASGNLTRQPTLSADDVAAWRDDRIVFDNTRLDMALAEFARYGEVPLQLASPDVAALRISGSFQVSKAGSFAKALPAVLPVVTKKQGNQVIIQSTARSGKKS